MRTTLYITPNSIKACTGWPISRRNWVAATVTTYCPSRVVEDSKSKSNQPRFARRWATLYNVFDEQFIAMSHEIQKI